MEDDDLEYDITFPSPVSPDLTEEIDSENPPLLDRKEPVIILLGWLGCKEKHIDKYGQFYDQSGCITIRYTAPGDVAFFQPSKLKGIACKVLDLLDDYSIADNPVFIHLFSNNGSYVYDAIVKVLTSGDEKFQDIQVYGAIIDSAPGKPRLLKAAQAYAASVNAGGISKYFMVLGMMVYLFFTGLLSWIMTIFSPGTKDQHNYFLFDAMAEHACRWPQLFLYSKSDRIVMYQDIEDMIKRRGRLGVQVATKCWPDTDHVSHFRKYPEEYTNICCEFVARNLGLEISEEVGNMEEESYETTEDYLLSKKQ